MMSNNTTQNNFNYFYFDMTNDNASFHHVLMEQMVQMVYRRQ